MLEDDSLWYRDAIIYELHVRAFSDSVGDGVGDFRGLTNKLEYLEDLGVTAVWLLPFYPSPLRDDGYDIADYTSIHPSYGQLQDFQEFLQAAHRRGIRVINELVVNHTSDQHPWFQRARRAAPGTPERDFYVWSDTPNKYTEARIIFQDFEPSNWTWDPLAKAYYWHRFYAHQPDLNFDNSAVWESLLPAVDFWMGMGVDGMRLDAVPYLFEREGTSCENLPETHAFLRTLRRHIDERFPHRMVLAEANQWPEDAAAYFGKGDECHMAFHFPLMPRLFMAIHMEDRFPVLDILAQTPTIPDNCQWCVFLRNHDELTLEMVTDEERDYMYGAYASDPRARINLGIRRRLAPLLGNNRRRIELMNGLLFSLPGTPVIYYGDEIGMGDNIYLGDRNGVRTPMQWSADRNAGFSRANPQKLYLPIIIDPEYHYEAVNVEAQQNNPNSLLWWMKRLIALRKRYKAFGRGTLEPIHATNRAVLVFLRRYESECILVVANLSRFVQHAELDLSRVDGYLPIEMFGGQAFPRIGKQAYSLTLGPHSFYWFALEPHVETTIVTATAPGPGATDVVWLEQDGPLFGELLREALEPALGEYLQRLPSGGPRRRWSKPASVQELWPLPGKESQLALCLVDAELDHRAPQRFLLPLAYAGGPAAEAILEKESDAVIARVKGRESGVIYDGFRSGEMRQLLLSTILDGRVQHFADGQLAGTSFLSPEQRAEIDPAVCAAPIRSEEQSNTSLVCQDRVILKLFRRAESGQHPEVEIGRFLGSKGRFTHIAPVWGTLEYRARRQGQTTLAILHGYVPNEGTAWQHALDEISQYMERTLSLEFAAPQHESLPNHDLLAELAPGALTLARDLIGAYLDRVQLLGRRTAELHAALAAPDDREFTPVPSTQLYQRSLYQSMRNVHRRALDELSSRQMKLPPEEAALAERVVAASDRILSRFQGLLHGRYGGQRIRIHGDYNLWEVLFTGKDFTIIDFEGDPWRTLSERRIKRSPLADVAAMIRSFDYAVSSALLRDAGPFRGRARGIVRDEDVVRLRPWAQFWWRSVAGLFWKAYRESTTDVSLLPSTPEAIRELLDIFLLERTLQELTHELQNRPKWVSIPLRELARMVEV